VINVAKIHVRGVHVPQVSMLHIRNASIMPAKVLGNEQNAGIIGNFFKKQYSYNLTQ